LARIDRGLKQTELSEMLGVVYQTIVKWENNMTPIGPQSQPRVIAFLGYDPTLPGANPTGDPHEV
jgi:DNA-binding XRE family transcriptional regulator